jgi:Flp pilus assembly protein TadD
MSSLSIKDAVRLAREHQLAGRFADAEALYRAVLERWPNHADALHLMGLLAHQTGKHDRAVELIRQAIEARPLRAGYHHNLGIILRTLGRTEEATRSFRRAIALEPGAADALSELGTCLMELDRIGEAEAAFRRAISLKPDWADAHNRLAGLLGATGRHNEAVEAAHRAIALNPEASESHNNLGASLISLGRYDDAQTAIETALRLDTKRPEAWSNLASLRKAQGDLDGALEAYDRAIELRSDLAAEARWNRSLVRLLKGDLAGGFEEFQWIRQSPLYPQAPVYRQPQWDGANLEGRRIVLWAEQGLGDTIQFARYAPLVAQRGGRVHIVCAESLKTLLQTVPSVERVCGEGEALPDFDVHCAMLLLPQIFRTTLNSIPAEVPYLSADPRKVESWRSRVNAEDGLLKAGVAWAGSPAHRDDRARSCAADELFPLTQVTGVRLFSLQKGSAARQGSQFRLAITDLTHDLHDFADTAALIANLDLVITVDTAVAHLAGAMAKPVWLMLPWVPDWRWMMGRSDSPWYPTARLFRQPAAGDWKTVIGSVARALESFSKGEAP